MLLSARLLNNVCDINSFELTQTLEISAGDTSEIYLQLTDASVDKTRDPAGRRYIPPSGSTLQITIEDIDSSVSITKVATQPFLLDASIWRIAFDPIADATAIAGLQGTYALKLTLIEPTYPNPLPAAYAAGTTYDLDDLVIYSGKLYRSLQDLNTGRTPGTEPLWWTQMNIIWGCTRTGFVGQAINFYRTSPEF